MTLEIVDLMVGVGPKRGARGPRKILLEAVSLSAAPGEVLGLCGPSGAGKTTLLRVSGGEVRPTAGAVTIAGCPIGQLTAPQLARIRGVLAQQTAIRFPLRALEIVLLGRLPHPTRGESPEDRAIAGAALELVEAAHLADRLAPTLSGGELQRVQLARALAQVWSETPGRPRLLLLDEPTASLDPGHASRILSRLRRFARATACAVVLAIHDLNAGAAVADRLALLHRGRLVACGHPAAVLTPERLRGCFDAPFDRYIAAEGPGFAVLPRPPDDPRPHPQDEEESPWITP